MGSQIRPSGKSLERNEASFSPRSNLESDEPPPLPSLITNREFEKHVLATNCYRCGSPRRRRSGHCSRLHHLYCPPYVTFFPNKCCIWMEEQGEGIQGKFGFSGVMELWLMSRSSSIQVLLVLQPPMSRLLPLPALPRRRLELTRPSPVCCSHAYI